MTAAWLDDQITIRVVLDRAAEPPDRIAAAIEAFVQALARRIGPSSWGVVDGPEWAGEPAELIEIVRANPSTAATGQADPGDGYSLTLYAKHGTTALSVGISLGGPSIGRRLPQQTVRGTIINPPGVPVDQSVAEAVFISLVEAWQPLFANLSASDINAAARRGNWKIPAGYRVWLRDGAVPLAHLAQGVTTSALAGGTLLTVPDDWPPDLVARQLDETYELNGVDVVPH